MISLQQKKKQIIIVLIIFAIIVVFLGCFLGLRRHKDKDKDKDFNETPIRTGSGEKKLLLKFKEK